MLHRPVYISAVIFAVVIKNIEIESNYFCFYTWIEKYETAHNDINKTEFSIKLSNFLCFDNSP